MESPRTQEKHKAVKNERKVQRQRKDLGGQHPFIQYEFAVCERTKKKVGLGSRTKDIIENFSELGEKTNLQIERAHQVPSRISKNKTHT